MNFLAHYDGVSEISERLIDECRSIWKDVTILRKSWVTLVWQQGNLSSVANSLGLVSAVTGWVRLTTSINTTTQGALPSSHAVSLRVCNGEWPLGTDVTGDFSGAAFREHECALFTTPFGVYPLYWLCDGRGLIVSTAMLPVARGLRLDIDLAGVAQAATPPYYSPYGRRTLYSGLHKMLPGEKKHYRNKEWATSYDNTLYAQEKSNDAGGSAERLMEISTADTRLLLGNSTDVAMAMSGGLDSRLVLASLLNAAKPRITCLTYGDSVSNYEVRLARRCADIAHADFHFCDITNTYYPSREDLFEQCRQTESLYVPSWTAVRDVMRERYPGTYLLYGDLFESVPGRKAKTIMTRGARIEWYKRRMMGKSIPLTHYSAVRWLSWARQDVADARRRMTSVLPQITDAQSHANVLQARLEDDMAEVQARILDHSFEYLDEAVELHQWYVNVRLDMARQMLIMSQIAAPVSPTQSLRFMRAVSSVHIETRVTGRLQQELLRHPAFGRLSLVPTTDIPYIPAAAPSWLRQLLWGSRWYADQRLMEKYMQGRSRRYRVVNTIDFRKLAAKPGATENVASWFSGTVINGDTYVQRTMERANHIARPMGNMDIMGPANAAIITSLEQGSLIIDSIPPK